jgi:spermidine synthase
VLAATKPFAVPATVMAGLRYLDAPTLASMFVLGPDMAPVQTEVNRLDNQALVRYYEAEWRRWN